MKDIIIVNSKLEEIKKAFSKEGKNGLHVISDFDRTLTTAFVNGKPRSSLISVLRKGNYLCKEYSKKGEAMYDKYHAIEISPKISMKEKKMAMHEWWTEHFRLLIKSKLNIKDLEKIVKSGMIEFRKGCLEFLDALHNYKIPLVIMSSSGLGTESISMYLENKKRLYDNIYIISNSFEWDKNDYAVSVKKPIIHSMNKDETVVKRFSFYKKIKNRKNVLLLGDSLGDIGMIKGFKYKSLIKIGFLNEKIEESLEKYKSAYDIIILNDGDMDYVNKLLKEIVR